MIVTRDSKTFSFNFDWSKYVDDNLKREIEFVCYKKVRIFS